MRAVLYSCASLLVCSLAIAYSVTPGWAADAPPDKAAVFIYYIPGEGPKTFGADLAIDGRVAVHLRGGVVFQTFLEPGSHDFLVTGLTGKRFTCRLDPGKNTYLRIVNRLRAFGIYSLGHAATFELVTRDQGELDISQGQLIPPDPKDLRPRKK